MVKINILMCVSVCVCAYACACVCMCVCVFVENKIIKIYKVSNRYIEYVETLMP